MSFSYGANLILNRISFSAVKGEFIGVIGPNGSGKTTLLKLINGILKPKVGCVFLSKTDVLRLTEKSRARVMASVPQNTYVPFDFNVWDVVMMGRYPHLDMLSWESKADEKIVEECMRLTDILHLAWRSIREVSGGERQRAIIARALAQEPKVLLLDEPTASLDINYQVGIMELLKRMNREKGLIVICAIHDLNLAARYCDRLILLNRGRIYAMGKPEEVLTMESIRRVFKVDAWVGKHPLTGSVYVIPLKHVEPYIEEAKPSNRRESAGVIKSGSGVE